MKTLTKIFAVAGAMALMTGCASRSDIDQLHSELHQLSAQVSQAEATANQALKEATAAHEHAGQAEALAKECKRMCAAHGAQMEQMFHKSMMK